MDSICCVAKGGRADLCKGHAVQLREAAYIALHAQASLLHYRAVHARNARLRSKDRHTYIETMIRHRRTVQVTPTEV